MRLLVVALVLALSGCPSSCAPPSLPVPDDAVVVGDAPRVGALFAEAVNLRGLLPERARGFFDDATPAMRAAAGIPEGARLVVALRSTGGLFAALALDDGSRFTSAMEVVAKRFDLALTTTPGGFELRDTRGAVVAVARVERRRALASIAPTDPPAARALLDAWAEKPGLPPPSSDAIARVVVDGPWISRVAEQPLPIVDVALELRQLPNGVALLGDVGLQEAARTWLLNHATPPPAAACAIGADAAIALRMPALDDDTPLPNALDDVPLLAAAEAHLVGPLALALAAPPAGTPADANDPLSLASILVVGTPRDARAEEALTASIVGVGGAGSLERVGTHGLRTFASHDRTAHHAVHAVVEPGLFALAIGAREPLAQALQATGACDRAPLGLVVDGARAAPIVARAADAFTPAALRGLRALTGDDTPPGAAAATWLAGLGRVEVEVRPAARGAHIEARLVDVPGRAAPPGM